ncbi:MAG: PEP-CTERM sorting domain-containing protein [Crocosphaera sp.]
MYKTLLTTTLVVGLTGMTQMQAKAATTFVFGGSNDLEESFTFIKDDITITVTGSAGDDPRDVIRRPSGIGVWNGRRSGDDREVDGFGPDETLSLLVDPEVSLITATFSRVGKNDDVEIVIGGDVFFSGDIPGGNKFDTGIGTVRISDAPFATQIDFTVTEKNDDYFLKKIKVDVVPEPLTILGAGTAIAFGAKFKRKLASKKG